MCDVYNEITEMKVLQSEQKKNVEQDEASVSTFVDTYRAFILAKEALRKSTVVQSTSIVGWRLGRGETGSVMCSWSCSCTQRDLVLAS